MREFAEWLHIQYLKPDWEWQIPPASTARVVRLIDLDSALLHVILAVERGDCHDWVKAIESEYPILTRDEREILLHNLARWYRQWQEEVNRETAD